jgi:putative transposase
MTTALDLADQVPVRRVCQVLDVPRSSFYRARHPQPPKASRPRPLSGRALTATEQATVRDTLNSERFADKSPYQVYATLLDDDRDYLCSISTMYRILHHNDEIRERRNQLQHPAYSKPELLATQPNQLWSWDITKLRGPATWSYYQLYVILDVFSRYVVGWRIAQRESDRLAEELIAESCFKQNIAPDQLTLHADRGPSMRSKTVAQLLLDLGVTKTHSRPHTANDNPYSETQFKTLKYRPDYPDRFGSIDEARSWSQLFFNWYNTDHRHTGLGLMTPATVHFGRAEKLIHHRHQTLQRAYLRHPERFVKGSPQPLKPPDAVWINKPAPSS